MVQKNIEKTNVFLTKKRIVLFSISGTIAIGLVIFSLVGILKINFNALISDFIIANQENALFVISILMLLLSPFFRTFQMFFIYLIGIKKHHIYASIKDLLSLVFIYLFIVSITPSSIGGEPWLMYWLRKHGMSLKKANAFVLYTSTIGQLSGTLITIPSFIYFLVNVFPQNLNNQFIIWFCSIGMFMEMIVFITFMIMSFSPRIQYWISCIFNRVLKWIGLNHKTKEQIKQEFLKNADFTKLMKQQYRDFTFCIFIFLIGLLSNFILYVIYYFAMNTVYPNQIPFWASFNAVNISVTANNFIPLPGSEGSLEVLMQKILEVSLPSISIDSINNGIFVWRTATNYLPALIGIIYLINFICELIINKKNIKLNQGIPNKRILILQNRAHNTIGGIETYNRYLIKIMRGLKYSVYELDFILDQDVQANKFIAKSLTVNKVIGDKKYYEKTRLFEQIDNTKNLFKQFYYMYVFIKNARKLVKEHLKNNSYDLIIDSSFFGFKFLAKNPNYVWIQHNSKKSHNGMIFNNWIMNWFGFISTKILGVYNTFKLNQNVVLYDKYNLKNLKIKHKHFYKIPLCYCGNFPKKIDLKPKEKICFIARLEKNQKRVDLLIKLAPLLNQPIYVYGTGPYEQKIKSTKNLIYCGSFDHNKITKILKDKKFCLILSNHEGFSFVALEAMVNGVIPIIRNTFPSASFFAQDDLAVLINKHKNAQKIANIINNLLDQNLNYKQKEILKFAKNNFSFILFKQRWKKVIIDLAKK